MRLIDADALMELYADEEGINFAVYNVPVPVVRQNILDMPTIEAEPVRHGRWIDAYCGKYANAKYICSCCGKRAYSDDWKWELSDFCPNCGAKMDGDSHDN